MICVNRNITITRGRVEKTLTLQSLSDSRIIIIIIMNPMYFDVETDIERERQRVYFYLVYDTLLKHETPI